jgi:hypothetical protein
MQDQRLFYLDPHTVQQTESTSTDLCEESSTFHTSLIRTIAVKQIDPSLALGFFCKDEKDCKNFWNEVKSIAVSMKYPLFSVQDVAPKHYCSLSSSDDDSDEEQDNVDEDDISTSDVDVSNDVVDDVAEVIAEVELDKAVVGQANFVHGSLESENHDHASNVQDKVDAKTIEADDGNNEEDDILNVSDLQLSTSNQTKPVTPPTERSSTVVRSKGKRKHKEKWKPDSYDESKHSDGRKGGKNKNKTKSGTKNSEDSDTFSDDDIWVKVR